MKSLYKSIYLNLITTLILAFAIFIILLFIPFKGNISGFYRIGNTLKVSPYLNQNELLIFHGGCDGQQFLTLALDPLMLNPQTKEALDNPSYRAKRIMFPALGYISGGGSPGLILYSLAIINFLSLAFLIFIASLWLKQISKPEKWAIYLLAIPSIWLVLSMSTSEILCAAFSMAALLYYKKNLIFPTILFLTFAVLTKETAFLMFIVILLSVLVKKRYNYVLYLLVPIVIFILWNLYLFYFLQLKDHSYEVTHHFSFPFQGIIQKFSYFLHADKRGLMYFFDFGTFCLLLFVIIVGVINAIKNFRIFSELSLIFFFQVALFLMFRTPILNNFGDYTRVCLEIYLYSFLMFPWSNKLNVKIISSASVLLSVGYIVGYLMQSSLHLPY